MDSLPSDITLVCGSVALTVWGVVGAIAFFSDTSSVVDEQAKAIRSSAVEEANTSKEASKTSSLRWHRYIGYYRWSLLSLTLFWEFLQLFQLTFTGGVPWPQPIKDVLKVFVIALTGRLAVVMFLVTSGITLAALLLFVALEWRYFTALALGLWGAKASSKVGPGDDDAALHDDHHDTAHSSSRRGSTPGGGRRGSRGRGRGGGERDYTLDDDHEDEDEGISLARVVAAKTMARSAAANLASSVQGGRKRNRTESLGGKGVGRGGKRVLPPLPGKGGKMGKPQHDRLFGQNGKMTHSSPAVSLGTGGPRGRGSAALSTRRSRSRHPREAGEQQEEEDDDGEEVDGDESVGDELGSLQEESWWSRWKYIVYEIVGALLLDIMLMPSARLALEMISCRKTVYDVPSLNAWPMMKCWEGEQVFYASFALFSMAVMYASALKFALVGNSLNPEFQYLPRFDVTLIMAELYFVILTTVLKGMSWAIIVGVVAGLLLLFSANITLQPCLGEGSISNHWRSGSFAGCLLAALCAVAQRIVNDDESYVVFFVMVTLFFPVVIAAALASRAYSKRIIRRLLIRLSALSLETESGEAASDLNQVANLALSPKMRRVVLVNDGRLVPDMSPLLRGDDVDVARAALRVISNLCVAEEGMVLFARSSVVRGVIEVIGGALRGMRSDPETSTGVAVLAFRTVTKLARVPRVNEHMVEDGAYGYASSVVHSRSHMAAGRVDLVRAAIGLLTRVGHNVVDKTKIIRSDAKTVLKILRAHGKTHPSLVLSVVRFITVLSAKGAEANRLDLGKFGAVEDVIRILDRAKGLDLVRSCVMALGNLCTTPPNRPRIHKRYYKRFAAWSRAKDEGLAKAGQRLCGVLGIRAGVTASER